MKYRHTPVLVNEVLENLSLKPECIIVDCNLGEGGHSTEIAKKLKPLKGKLIGIERDEKIFNKAKENLKGFREIVTLINDNFINLKKVLADLNINKVDNVLFDLGISTYHYFDDNRGFSFLNDQPLDMRLDKNCEYSASEILNTFDEKKIAEILIKYGEERFAKRIAGKIVRFRQEKEILTTGTLVQIVDQAIPDKFKPKKISPATKTFQALRIFINNELDNVENVLPETMDILNKGGRLLVITFHSLEDRIVKHFIRDNSRKCTCPPQLPVCVCGRNPVLKNLTGRAIVPTEQEIKNNNASRSAKLRVAEKQV